MSQESTAGLTTSYVGNSCKASNLAGIEWLGNYLGADYQVHEIEISPEFEHPDCIMALLMRSESTIMK